MGKKFNDEDILVRIDVSSVHTSILHNEGISAISKSLEENDPLKRMLICRLTKHVLTRNYFEFNSKLYFQKQGTAMRTRMAPPMPTYS